MGSKRWVDAFEEESEWRSIGQKWSRYVSRFTALSSVPKSISWHRLRKERDVCCLIVQYTNKHEQIAAAHPPQPVGMRNVSLQWQGRVASFRLTFLMTQPGFSLSTSMWWPDINWFANMAWDEIIWFLPHLILQLFCFNTNPTSLP